MMRYPAPTLTFDYTDTAGNTAATVTRTVVVEDTSAPVITLLGDTNVTHEAGSDYTDLGATWSDAVMVPELYRRRRGRRSGTRNLYTEL